MNQKMYFLVQLLKRFHCLVFVIIPSFPFDEDFIPIDRKFYVVKDSTIYCFAPASKSPLVCLALPICFAVLLHRDDQSKLCMPFFSSVLVQCLENEFQLQ